MKRLLTLISAVILCMICLACNSTKNKTNIVTTTLPVYDITTRLCENTGLSIARLISENVSCLHDYSLNPNQMKLAESADLLVISGAGFEDFMDNIIASSGSVADASVGIALHNSEHEHEDSHTHEQDPHIWLSPKNGKTMAGNIYTALCARFPEHKEAFQRNFVQLKAEFDAVSSYAETALSNLSCRKLITFHNSFHYMADAFGLTIAKSIEEESGSEASAHDLISICNLVEHEKIPAIFTERNGSDRAATIVSGETGAKIFALDTGLSGNSYFDALYHNINTLKEALG